MISGTKVNSRGHRGPDYGSKNIHIGGHVADTENQQSSSRQLAEKIDEVYFDAVTNKDAWPSVEEITHMIAEYWEGGKTINKIDWTEPLHAYFLAIYKAGKIRSSKMAELLGCSTESIRKVASKGRQRGLGVYWDKKSSKWRAEFNRDGKTYYLGMHVNKDDALKAVAEMKGKLNDHS